MGVWGFIAEFTAQLRFAQGLPAPCAYHHTDYDILILCGHYSLQMGYGDVMINVSKTQRMLRDLDISLYFKIVFMIYSFFEFVLCKSVCGKQCAGKHTGNALGEAKLSCKPRYEAPLKTEKTPI